MVRCTIRSDPDSFFPPSLHSNLIPYARECGDDHTDPVFDVAKSSSYHALDCQECQFSGHCKDGKCSVSLAYAEGSRWDAYEVRACLPVGG